MGLLVVDNLRLAGLDPDGTGIDAVDLDKLLSSRVQRHVAGAFAHLPGTAFCFAKVPEGDAASSATIERLGFRLVVTQVTLERGADPAPAAPRLVVRRAELGDRDTVLDIACSCFRFSRFHGATVAIASKKPDITVR